ncbi:MAG: CoA transferase [Anaerolineae bacterium]|nr:CoA transferase [Anaerolineae bacterium]
MLTGIRVVSVEVGAAGPFAARLLADLGASVVKVEPPDGGDIARSWDTACKGLSAAHVWLNRNKRSLTLDLKQPAGREVFMRLAAEADIVLENFRPGAVARLGIDYEAVKAVNPRIIYGHISGFGQEGPYRDAKAFDMIIQGEAGLILMNGSPDAPAKIPLSICDLTAGFYAAIGMLGLLERRNRTGQGAEFEIAMLESVMSLLGYFPHWYWHRGEEPKRTGMRHHLLTPYGPYTAGDGLMFSIAILSDAAWKAFCREVVEVPELLDDPRFVDNETRIANRVELETRLGELFATRPQHEWLARLSAAGIPCGRVNTLATALEHPQNAFLGTIADLDTPAGPMREIVSPIRVKGVPTVFERVPGLGEQTDEVLKEVGFSDDEIASLRAKRTI